MTKLEQTTARLSEWFERFDHPVVMCSFGKDSMVMLFIILRVMEKKLPVIYHSNPWQPWKNDWAWKMIKEWQLEVYDPPPYASGIKVKEDRIEIVHCYQIRGHPLYLPVNILSPNGHSMCGLKMLERPKGVMDYPWNLILIGHKSCDVDPFDGHIPLKMDLIELEGAPTVAFPLREWSDEELWDYIEAHRIPIQYGTRYIDRKEIEYKEFNPDYIESCTACIDPRNPAKVHCPLVNREIDNVSGRVPRFEGKPSYIGE